MSNSTRATALSVCLVILASILGVACVDPSGQGATSPTTMRAQDRDLR